LSLKDGTPLPGWPIDIMVVDPTGKAIAKLGDFNGIKDGASESCL
jgi:hypothetical protein